MKSITVFLISFLLSMVLIFFLANSSEQGDTTAVSMYFVVFLLPAFLLAVFDALYISALNRLTNKVAKSILCFIPVIVLSLLSLRNNLTIHGFDGNLVFAAKVGAISLGLTNLLWIVSMLKPKEAKT